MSKHFSDFNTKTLFLAFLVVFLFTLIGFGISLYINSYLPLWLTLGFSLIYSINKWFSNFTRKHKNIGKIFRILLNLSILSLLGLIINSGIKLFTRHFLESQLIGCIFFVAEIILFICLWIIVSKNSWRWPSMKLTVFSIICLFLIFSFAGVQPFSKYKDDVIEKVGTIIKTQKAEAEKRATEQKIEEIKKLSELGFSNPTATAESLSKDKELKLGLEVLEKVNAIRKGRGSSELKWDDTLYKYSLAHAKDMASQQRLFHSSVDEPYAENAWGGEGSKNWNAQTIVDGWMNSDMHRTWLLCPNLKHIAVGVADLTPSLVASLSRVRPLFQHTPSVYFRSTSYGV